MTTEEKKPEVVVNRFCERHESDILHHRLKVPESGPWVATLVTMQLLMLNWLMTDKRIYARSENGRVEDLTLVLAEVGCMACYDNDGYNRALSLFRVGGLDYAARVAQGKASDRRWPIDERSRRLTQ